MSWATRIANSNLGDTFYKIIFSVSYEFSLVLFTSDWVTTDKTRAKSFRESVQKQGVKRKKEKQEWLLQTFLRYTQLH